MSQLYQHMIYIQPILDKACLYTNFQQDQIKQIWQRAKKNRRNNYFRRAHLFLFSVFSSLRLLNFSSPSFNITLHTGLRFWAIFHWKVLYSTYTQFDLYTKIYGIFLSFKALLFEKKWRTCIDKQGFKYSLMISLRNTLKLHRILNKMYLFKLIISIILF